MRLVDLNPKFLSSYGENGAETKGMGVDFDCPCGNKTESHRLFVPFANPIGPGPYAEKEHPRGWQRQGDTFDTLHLSPSILRMESKEEDGIGCRWHGFIHYGEVITV
jgi:hypothetical protein